MAESSFAQYGYLNENGDFVPKNIRAQDVVDTHGVSAETHQTNGAIHLTTQQAALIAGAIQSAEKGAANGVAPLGGDGKIPSQYISINLTDASLLVADYTALLALNTTAAPLKTTALVQDATGDSTVESGWALYYRVATAGAAADWLKLSEGESLDIDFSQFILNSQKGAAGGVATLDVGGKVPASQLPDTATALDAAYCVDETDMRSKNLRPGAVVLMEVQNSAAG